MPSLLPNVSSCRFSDGFFEFSLGIAHIGPHADEAAALLSEYLSPAMGRQIPVTAASSERTCVPGAILLIAEEKSTADDFGFVPEDYSLSITEQSVVIRATNHIGLLRGIQTLRQLFPIEIYATTVQHQHWRLPIVEIKDAPAFRWRGLHLDVCRHFFSVAEVCRFIEIAAQHKYNVLHFHLTDDQGWRIEIEAYPKLTKIGANRPCSEIVDNDHADSTLEPVMDSTPYGGFYTKADIREILAFAARRGITIMPEIEMPGHVQAAIAAYPFLGCTPDNPPGVKTTWRTGKVVLNPNQQSIDFFQNVLKEVIELFPSRVIHIGGDEVNFEQWQNLPEAARIIDENGLTSYRELEYWFMTRMASYVESQGRIAAGWDGGIPIRGMLCTAWLGERGAVIAARLGIPAVNINCDRLYFDHYQAEPSSQPPAFDRNVIQSCQRVYETSIISKQITARQWIIGGEGALWTEHIPDFNSLEYMAYPRACALAEKLWCEEAHCDYSDFLTRLASHRQRLALQGIHACSIP